MPLFKAQNLDRSKKVTVCAASLADLTSLAVKKLTLPAVDSAYIVYDDSDGTMIDDDECLVTLAEFWSTKGQHLVVILLPADVQWSRPQQVQPQPETPRTPRNHEETVQTVTPTVADTTALPPLPYKDYTAQLNQAAKSPQHLRNKALVRARRNVSKMLADKLKHRMLPPGVVKMVCQKFQTSCPEAFVVMIKETPTSCFPFFVKAVYNAINYAREADVTTHRRRVRRTGSSSEEDIDNPQEEVPHLCLDSNGCAEGMWEPLLSDEDVETMETLRTSIMTFPADDPHALNLLKTAYPLQRHQINRARTNADWVKVFEGWPTLQWHPAFLTHANILMGKNTPEVWSSELGDSLIIKEFFVTYIENKESLSRRDNLIKDWLTKAAEAAETHSSVVPFSIVIFICLVEYFQESISNLFLLVNTLLTREEILKESSEVTQCPLLVVQGSSIFDIDAVTYVAIRGQFLIKCHDVIQGVLIQVLGFFVFNISYPKSLKRTLEFVQRYILLVNPSSKPTRKDGKSNKVNSAVATLTGLLSDFEASQSRWQ